MIKILHHDNLEIAKTIREVFQLSYAIEAKLLKASDFPPLKRPLQSYMDSTNVFFGYFENDELAAVIEINHKTDATHIQSLVVDPKYFRRGIAVQLIEYLFTSFASKVYTVETGLANTPACLLYEKMGFKEVNQYDTDHNIRKICFKRII